MVRLVEEQRGNVVDLDEIDRIHSLSGLDVDACKVLLFEDNVFPLLGNGTPSQFRPREPPARRLPTTRL